MPQLQPICGKRTNPPPKVPRFSRSRPDSQFRGIAEVVKEFMEYIADSPLHEDRDQYSAQCRSVPVPSGGDGGGVLGYTRPFRQSGLVLSPFSSHLLVSQIFLNGLFFSQVVAGLKVIHLYRSYLGSGFQARCEMELVCSSQARQVPKKSFFFTQKYLPAPQENEVLHEKLKTVLQQGFLKFIFLTPNFTNLLHFFNYNLTFSI